MKIRIMMKTPDCVDEALDKAYDSYSDDRERAKELCRKWFRYGEICTLEVDTCEGTISVIPAYTTTK